MHTYDHENGARFLPRYARELAAAGGIVAALVGAGSAYGYRESDSLASGGQIAMRNVGFVAASSTVVRPPSPKPVATVTGEKRVLGAAVSTRNWDTALRAAFTANFNSLTPENEMKMVKLQPKPNSFDFAPADELVNFSLKNGGTVHGHVLVYPTQDPYYIQKNLTSCDRNGMINTMNHNIDMVVGHFKDRVHEWDVTNETADKNNPYERCIGPGYIAMAFRRARAADPTADLYYSEYDAERPVADGKPNPRYEDMMNTLDRLQKEGVPVTGVALQTHVRWTSDFPAHMDDLGQTIHTLGDKGLKVQLSEVDVTRSQNASPEQIQAQNQTFVDIAKQCGTQPACVKLTYWGVNNKVSWLSLENPLPIDSNNTSTAALAEVRQWLNPAPRRKKKARKHSSHKIRKSAKA